MNKLILCEGKTDAILLSYYLIRMKGWKVLNGREKTKLANLDIKATEHNQNVDWYQKGEDHLLICAVGGKDNFGNFFREKILEPIKNANAFQRIAIIIDRDKSEIDEIEISMTETFGGFFPKLQNRSWLQHTYVDGFGEEQEIDSLLLVIPENQQGALETTLLKAISEEPYDKVIVDACGDFVSEIRAKAEKYIDSDRMELKAHLSATWAIQTPDKAFDFIDEQIRAVKWEKSTELKECFAELLKI